MSKQNTEKCLGDLRRFALTQAAVKGHQFMLVKKKTDKEYNNKLFLKKTNVLLKIT